MIVGADDRVELHGPVPQLVGDTQRGLAHLSAQADAAHVRAHGIAGVGHVRARSGMVGADHEHADHVADEVGDETGAFVSGTPVAPQLLITDGWVVGVGVSGAYQLSCDVEDRLPVALRGGTDSHRPRFATSARRLTSLGVKAMANPRVELHGIQLRLDGGEPRQGVTA